MYFVNKCCKFNLDLENLQKIRINNDTITLLNCNAESYFSKMCFKKE